MSTPSRSPQSGWSHLEPLARGDVLEVRAWWGQHPGIMVGWTTEGEPVVAHCSRRRGRVCEEPLTAFAGSDPVARRPLPYPLPVEDVVRRARETMGRPWHLLTFNCEHFVGQALGLKPRSPQVRAWGTAVGALASAALAGAAIRHVRRRRNSM